MLLLSTPGSMLRVCSRPECSEVKKPCKGKRYQRCSGCASSSAAQRSNTSRTTRSLLLLAMLAARLAGGDHQKNRGGAPGGASISR
jgi:hypothetical protein